MQVTLQRNTSIDVQLSPWIASSSLSPIPPAHRFSSFPLQWLLLPQQFCRSSVPRCGMHPMLLLVCVPDPPTKFRSRSQLMTRPDDNNNDDKEKRYDCRHEHDVRFCLLVHLFSRSLHLLLSLLLCSTKEGYCLTIKLVTNDAPPFEDK